MANLIKFETRAPSAQTAVDVFRDRWACDLHPLLGVDGTGPNLLFTQDQRPRLAAQALGRADYQGMKILEIGPLEAAHTYILETMGAESVTTVEASAEAWLKCLIVKELLGLKRSTFLFGNALEFLANSSERFDLVFCSGVLYHMSDPARLIRAMADAADNCFVWTHVYNPERHPVPFTPTQVEREGIQLRYWSHTYGQKEEVFWGGVDQTAVWLTSQDMVRAFKASGLSDVTIIEDQPNHPNGPAVMFMARRPLSNAI
ncbi:DUF1698 domain-containing protein [Lichenihabitans sp. Uapishka_5]|uniref:class I SAM-dependent methyltransferase n=1 Tax=Lichenihabitans sp. Uapishka_5 TaxID=3037302 RepID=UPI0029E7CF56|nr:DUF1698 domain-containing protein [Lichenihabitans sp. Uapishka_5]MDX7953360.1 DUF1698 domain-containing protein [Lichenihabitans sp. Uapishka_5]